MRIQTKKRHETQSSLKTLLNGLPSTIERLLTEVKAFGDTITAYQKRKNKRRRIE